MSESLIMPDSYLAALANSGVTLKLKDQPEFLEPWHGVDKHANEIFQCLEINRPTLNTNAKLLLQALSKAKRKNMLQTL